MEYTPSAATVAFFQKYPNALPIYELEDGSKRWLNTAEAQAIDFARANNKVLYKITNALIVTQHYPAVVPVAAKQGGDYYDA